MLKFNGYMERTDRSWRHYFIDLNTETDFNDPNMEVNFRYNIFQSSIFILFSMPNEIK